MGCDSGKAQLGPVDVKKLQRIARLLKRNSQLRVRIEAYTDNGGANAHNEEPLERLANAVSCDLIERGGDAGRIQAQIREEDSPVGCVETAKVRQLHHRVQILFSDAEGQFNPATQRSPNGSSRA
jgi:outer membrane protein OmpA-like peptidoglycan-associated protein